MKKRITVGSVMKQVFLIAWLFLCLFPLYWMFTMSLKDTNEIFGANSVGLPTQWLWGNYANAWGSGGRVSRYMINSVIDTFATLGFTSLLGGHECFPAAVRFSLSCQGWVPGRLWNGLI